MTKEFQTIIKMNVSGPIGISFIEFVSVDCDREYHRDDGPYVFRTHAVISNKIVVYSKIPINNTGEHTYSAVFDLL